MKVGLLTGGGDCPGLNAVIRAVVQQLANEGSVCVGILEGWRGLVQNMTCPLTVADTDGIISQGGSILGSSRTNPYRSSETSLSALRENFAQLGLDALIVIGGDDTLGVALRLHNDFGLPVVGVPKTIDNDLAVTDFSFGFDTAVNIVTEAVDRLRTTTESHRRIDGYRDHGPALRLDRVLCRNRRRSRLCPRARSSHRLAPPDWCSIPTEGRR